MRSQNTKGPSQAEEGRQQSTDVCAPRSYLVPSHLRAEFKKHRPSVSVACGGSGIILLLLTAPSLSHTHSVSVHKPSSTHTHTHTHKRTKQWPSSPCHGSALPLAQLTDSCPDYRRVTLKCDRKLNTENDFYVCSKLHSEFVHQFEACKNERHDSLCIICHVFSFL